MKNKGFTLIESLLFLVIVSLLVNLVFMLTKIYEGAMKFEDKKVHYEVICE